MKSPKSMPGLVELNYGGDGPPETPVFIGIFPQQDATASDHQGDIFGAEFLVEPEHIAFTGW